MKLWHHLHIWILTRRAQSQRRKLALFLHESAQEICAWQQAISFTEEDIAYHRKTLEEKGAPREEPRALESSNVVLLKSAA